jgi:hypothetical protein
VTATTSARGDDCPDRAGSPAILFIAQLARPDRRVRCQSDAPANAGRMEADAAPVALIDDQSGEVTARPDLAEAFATAREAGWLQEVGREGLWRLSPAGRAEVRRHRATAAMRAATEAPAGNAELPVAGAPPVRPAARSRAASAR